MYDAVFVELKLSVLASPLEWNIVNGWGLNFTSVHLAPVIQEMDFKDRQFKVRGDGAILPCPKARATGLLIRGKSAFDENLTAFMQILIADFRLLSPGGTAEPGGGFDNLAFFTGVLIVVGNAERGYWRAGWGVTHVRICPEMTDKSGFVVLF